MKIYIKLIRVILWINLLLCGSLSTLSAKLPSDNLDEIKRNLGAGINISLFEHYWTTPEFLYEENITQKLNVIAKAGFKTIRLPIAFDNFLAPNSFNLQPQIIAKIKEIYGLCEARKLNLIITYHYGKLNDYNTYGETERITWIWKQIQRQFTGQGYNELFFELYNEPVMSGSVWKNTIITILQNLRYEDKNRIYIIGGTNYNSLDELINMGKLPDNRIFYCFHFYEPFIFTHQGASWTNNKTYIKDLPYPYKKNNMPRVYPQSGSSVEKDLSKYPQEATPEYLRQRFQYISDFCMRNNMPLICTETGVIKLANQSSRKNYLKDVTNILHDLGIQTMLWDYDDKFSIKKNDYKIERYLHKWLVKSKN